MSKSNTPTWEEAIDSLRAEIHFKENSIPSVHAGLLTEKTKSEIIQLFKDLVAEAKPTFRLDKKGHFPKDKSQDAAFNAGITQFEYNLLKLLDGEDE